MTAAKVMDIISGLLDYDGHAADAVSAYTLVKTFGFVYHDTNVLNHGPVWKTQSLLLNVICIVILCQTVMGKIIRENLIEARLGKDFQLVMSLCILSKKIIFICVNG